VYAQGDKARASKIDEMSREPSSTDTRNAVSEQDTLADRIFVRLAHRAWAGADFKITTADGNRTPARGAGRAGMQRDCSNSISLNDMLQSVGVEVKARAMAAL